MLLAALLATPLRAGADPMEGGLRSVGGNPASKGRLEVFLNRSWGTVCDHGFDQRDAAVACRQLGYPAPSAIGDADGGGLGLDIWMRDPGCSGAETRLIDCPYNGRLACFHFEDVRLSCSATALPEVTIVADAASVTEGDPATFTLTRETGAPATVRVSIWETGRTLAPGKPNRVTFAAGAATATLTVATEDDLVVEQDSTVTVEVANQSSTFTFTAGAAAAVTVVNDDPPDEDHFRGKAQDLGTLTPADGTGSRTDSLNGVSDAVDYYVFALNQPARVALQLTGLDYDADLMLEHANGDTVYLGG